MQKKRWIEWLWDSWCTASVIGIWPRFIEPKWLWTTKRILPIPQLPKELEGLSILHFSDLHWNGHFSSVLAKQMIKQAKRLKPDIILFTGDFLTRSVLYDQSGLVDFLNSFQAKHGCFAVLGNHDYEKYVTVSEKGDYDLAQTQGEVDIVRGFKCLFSPLKLTKKVTVSARQVPLHQALLGLLAETPFRLLNNDNTLLSIKGSGLNICGLGEYTLGQCRPPQAFSGYDLRYPGIILVHNPDAVPMLSHYPGDLVLAGHTHGGQINLPWMWKKFTPMERPDLKRGLKRIGEKWISINRGVGCVIPFRWFAPPEFTYLTLTRGT